MLNKFFKFEERNTNLKKEVIAGITTFLSMAYILGVNPELLSQSGMPISGVFFATAISAGIGCILMGLISNFPIGLAPVMGINALFTYTIVLSMGNTWECALAAIFLSNIIFLIISILRIRDKIFNAIPKDLKFGVTAGIGFFLTFLGLRFANIIVSNSSTLVAMGDLFKPSTLLALIGIFITIIFYIKKIPVGLFLSIILTSLIGLIFTFFGYGVNDSLMPAIPTAIMSFDFDFSLFGAFLKGFGQLFSNISNLFVIIFSLVFVSFFDTTGTIVSLAHLCGCTDENGEIIGFKQGLISCALAGIIGAVLGTSSVSSYVESATGIGIGGRTGFTAIIVGICFLGSVLFSTFILCLFPSSVSASALILVGMLMTNQLQYVEYTNSVVGISVFFIIIMMMLTNTISSGIAWGFLIFTVLSIVMFGFKDVNKTMLVLSVLFLLYLFFGI